MCNGDVDLRSSKVRLKILVEVAPYSRFLGIQSDVEVASSF